MPLLVMMSRQTLKLPRLLRSRRSCPSRYKSLLNYVIHLGPRPTIETIESPISHSALCCLSAYAGWVSKLEGFIPAVTWHTRVRAGCYLEGMCTLLRLCQWKIYIAFCNAAQRNSSVLGSLLVTDVVSRSCHVQLGYHV